MTITAATARWDHLARGCSVTALHQLLEATAPFHIVFDRRLLIIQGGRSIPRLCPQLKVGDRLDEHLTLEHPAEVLTSETLHEQIGSLVLFKTRATNATLRGEIVELPCENEFCFLGSPKVTAVNDLWALGLAPTDFAVSDPTLDYMVALDVGSARTDPRQLAGRLQDRDLGRHTKPDAECELIEQLEPLCDLLMRVDRGGKIGELRGRFGITIPSPPAALIGLQATQAVPEMGRRLQTALDLAFAGEDSDPFTYDAVRAGLCRHFDARVLLWPGDQAIVLVRDATDQRQIEQQLARQAFEDPLTGLGNRTFFYARSQQALACGEGQPQVAVLLIDIDDFKLTNDGLGHNYGDELLTTTAQRLACCVRPGDTIARLGGDEFGILLEGASAFTARAISKRIVRALSTPVQLLEHAIPVTVSVGIAVAHATDGVDELLRKADVAMYRAKAAGKSRFATYRATSDVSLNRIELETELRRALENAELCVWYQPIVGLKTRSLIGFEALVRWDHPMRGILTPAEFIPLAEQSNLIVQIGERVLDSACRQASRWQRAAAGSGPPMVSVNVSSRQLTDRALVRNVERILEETGLDPGLLILEITETALMPGHEHALETLRRLHQLGLAIALDDFGTGYSSLSRLQLFPVDAIKIDKSFVDGITEGGQAAAFARVVIQLAQIVGVESVAEGVERLEQLEQLVALNCNSAQGHIFGPPLRAEDATAFMNDRGRMLLAGKP